MDEDNFFDVGDEYVQQRAIQDSYPFTVLGQPRTHDFYLEAQWVSDPTAKVMVLGMGDMMKSLTQRAGFYWSRRWGS